MARSNASKGTTATRPPCSAGLGLGHADVADLRVGEGHPGDRAGVEALRLHPCEPGQGIARGDQPHPGGGVGELQAVGDVTDGPDAPHVRGHRVIGLDEPTLAKGDTDIFEPETTAGRQPADRHQDPRRVDRNPRREVQAGQATHRLRLVDAGTEP